MLEYNGYIAQNYLCDLYKVINGANDFKATL